MIEPVLGQLILPDSSLNCAAGVKVMIQPSFEHREQLQVATRSRSTAAS